MTSEVKSVIAVTVAVVCGFIIALILMPVVAYYVALWWSYWRPTF